MPVQRLLERAVVTSRSGSSGRSTTCSRCLVCHLSLCLCFMLGGARIGFTDLWAWGWDFRL